MGFQMYTIGHWQEQTQTKPKKIQKQSLHIHYKQQRRNFVILFSSKQYNHIEFGFFITVNMKK